MRAVLTAADFLLIIWFVTVFFWFLFLFLNPESPLLFPYYPRKSLHFVKRRMENVIDQCLQKPAVSLKEMHGFCVGARVSTVCKGSW